MQEVLRDGLTVRAQPVVSLPPQSLTYLISYVLLFVNL